MRKERAQSDLQFKREVQRAELAESEVQQLQTQLENLESLLLAQKTQNDADMQALRAELERSVWREQQLQAVVAETHRLLVLNGINSL